MYNNKVELVRQQGTLEFEHVKILVLCENLTLDFVKQKVLATNFEDSTKRTDSFHGSEEQG